MPDQNQSSVDRRQFVKGAIASAAAGAAGIGIARTAAGCPISYDANGKLIEWACIVDVLDSSGPFEWLYLYEICSTRELVQVWDVAYLPLGDCHQPTTPACIDKKEMEIGFQKFVHNGCTIRLSPKCSAGALSRLDARKDELVELIYRRINGK